MATDKTSGYKGSNGTQGRGKGYDPLAVTKVNAALARNKPAGTLSGACPMHIDCNVGEGVEHDGKGKN